jgi:hypothetical protein
MPTPSGPPPVDPFSGMEYVLAENLVQGYQQANYAGALDMLMFALIVFIVLGGIWSIMSHLKRL